MKTALQELIDAYNTKIGHLFELLLESERQGRRQESFRLSGKIEGYKNCKQDAEAMLEFERQQIEDAFNQGYRERDSDGEDYKTEYDVAQYKRAEKYITQTYEQ